MKKRMKLKPFVLPAIYTIFVITLMVTVLISKNTYNEMDKDNLIYVTSTILNDYVPVVNLDIQIVKPYTNEEIKVGIDYYKPSDSEENRSNSIVYYSGTYMPNTGIDYISENKFDIVSILDGEVIEVKEEELLGKTITIRHDNDLISIYQGLSEINVEKDEHIAIGQVIGKSGISELNKNLGNHLHFELLYKGQTVDPEDFYDKKLNEIE